MLSDLVLEGQRFLLVEILLNMGLAFVLGLAIAIVYTKTHKSFNYSFSFVNTLVLLPMITAIVMMVIGNNLARAFGLVGAMSIIRFRTVVKDTRDIAFVFLALATGMAAGTGYHLIAAVGSLSVLLIIVLLYLGNFGSVRSRELLLRFSITSETNTEMPQEQVFQKYLKKSTLLDIQSRQEGRILELSYFVRLRSTEKAQEFTRALGTIDGIEGVSLIAMEETAEA